MNWRKTKSVLIQAATRLSEFYQKSLLGLQQKTKVEHDENYRVLLAPSSIRLQWKNRSFSQSSEFLSGLAGEFLQSCT
jgi:hypothetical protein